MKSKPAASTVEWIGGIVSLPAFVTGEDEPFRPEGLIWMDEDGLVQGMATEMPGVLLALAGAKLHEAIATPLCGGREPTRVRVASRELAEVLRHTHARLDVVCAPTPEIDEMLSVMRTSLGSQSAQELSYLSSSIDATMVASFFNAAAELFRAQPWKIVPDDRCLIQASIEALDVHDAVICTIGQMGESFGFLLFPGITEFDIYLEAARDADSVPDLQPEWPRFLSLNFERGADLSPAARKEVAAHRWEVAGRDAYPWPIALEEGLLHRQPSARELRILEAISRALAQLISEASALQAAWQGAESVSRTMVVAAQDKDVEVTLHTLARSFDAEDPLSGLLELELDGDELDPEARSAFENVLLEAFAASPEGAGCEHRGNCAFVMDLAADYLGVTIAGLDDEGLREVLFEIMPRKASVDAAEAPFIVEELRAFYQFLKRAYAFSGADACLRILGRNAATKLAAGLSDTSQFGMAKSLVMAGRESGFDMSTQEGIETWMRSMQGKPLPPSIRLPPSGFRAATPGKPGKAEKKSKRKAVRAARRKNR